MPLHEQYLFLPPRPSCTQAVAAASACNVPVPEKLHWAPLAQNTTFRTLPQQTGKRRQDSRIFAAWLQFFCSVLLSGSEDLLLASLDGVFWSVGCSYGTQPRQLFARLPSARGQRGVSSAFAFPLIPAGTGPALRGLTSRLHFLSYLKLQISSQENIFGVSPWQSSISQQGAIEN